MMKLSIQEPNTADSYDIKPFLRNTARSIKKHFIEDNKGFYLIMSMLLVLSFIIGYQLSNPIRTEQDKERLLVSIDYLVENTAVIEIGQFKVNENKTISELRSMYKNLREQHPEISSAVVLSLYNEVCR